MSLKYSSRGGEASDDRRKPSDRDSTCRLACILEEQSALFQMHSLRILIKRRYSLEYEANAKTIVQFLDSQVLPIEAHVREEIELVSSSLYS